MDQRHTLITLVDAYSAHAGVGHFAVSMRIFGKGDFFHRLKINPKADCRTRTADRTLSWFDANWPDDLEWPAKVPRPSKAKERAA